jgi:hypothetical protein
MAKRVVEIGQRYRALHNHGRIWEVEELIPADRLHPHARLRAVEDRTEARTIACAVLLDSHRYTPVA